MGILDGPWVFVKDIVHVYFVQISYKHVSKLKLNSSMLLYKVNTQYVQISNTIDTSIERLISGQSTSMVKDCIVSIS